MPGGLGAPPGVEGSVDAPEAVGPAFETVAGTMPVPVLLALSFDSSSLKVAGGKGGIADAIPAVAFEF